MNDEVFALATQLVSPSYVAQAQQARRARETKFKSWYTLDGSRSMPSTLP